MKSWRINLVFILIILFSGAIVGRLIYLQILNHQYWQALAQGQQKFFVQTQGERGEIFFKGGEPLAVNKNWKLVFSSPKEIAQKEEVAEKLASILDLDKNFILEKIKKDSYYELIKKKLTSKEVEELKKLNLPGIYLEVEQGRYYPYEGLASQTIGFLNAENRGQYGIEEYYDEILRGKEGFLAKEKGPGGYLINGFSNSSQRGSDLILTLDYNIQFQAEKLLKKAKENLDIEGGQIIVIDPNSGKIFALSNFPNFDPNCYSRVENIEIFQNGAIQKIFEPGSIFKPITMAAALEEEKITPYTTYVDCGFVKVGDHTIYNYDEISWGEQTMTQVLENSINTGAVFVEKKLDHNLFLEYLQKFGIFEPTGIDLAGEVFSENLEFKKGYEINFATASFGQGIEMTPIQIVRALSAIANGGKLITPHLIEKIIRDGKEIKISPNFKEKQIISQRTASQLTAMLVSSVEKGYAKRAKIPGYYIAGKTGTSQIPFSSFGENILGYSNKTWQTFVGWLPAFNPRFLVLVKLDNPKAKIAGTSTTLIARDLMKYLIDYYQIPPDYGE
ncbi:MAG: penicillin-binding protein 2 [Patescibacteria group bacterium]|nr:penicillin-binding protein 2 [Patescibacteria group bacterium]